MEVEHIFKRLLKTPKADNIAQYIAFLQEAERSLSSLNLIEVFFQSTIGFKLFLELSQVLNIAYTLYSDYEVFINKGLQSEKLNLKKSIQNIRSIVLNNSVIQNLDESALPSSDVADLVVNLANIASKSDNIDFESGFQAWTFLSRFLSVFHSQLEDAFVNDLENTPTDEAYRSDKLLDCMLISIKRLFTASLSGAKANETEKSAGSQWKNTLKLAVFICRLIIGCLRQFSFSLFVTAKNAPTRSIVKFVVWILEIQFAGGLFPQGTGLPEAFKKEVETSLFVASHVALACVAQIELLEGHSISAAAEAIRVSSFHPLIKTRIFIGILQGLAKQCSEDCYSLWLNDEFNIYTYLFESIEEGLSEWKPYEKSPQLSNFGVPQILQLSHYSSKLSTSVEEFLTDISIQLNQTVRNLPISSFPYLESAFLRTVLHSSPVISLLAQDSWCFTARYGNADLCWQYVILLSNTILCLAERFEEDDGGRPPRAPLEQLSRLGNLLSRLVVFLTVRQQREYLTNFPLFDELSYGATDKSVVWRFLTIRLSQFQPAIHDLMERQLMERINFLLSQPQTATWMLDTLICLRLVRDLPAATLASNSVSLSQLVAAALTSKVDCSSSTCLVAPPHLIHLVDAPMRTEAIVACLAGWFPRLLWFATLPNHGKDSELNDESRQLVQMLLTELKSSCSRSGLSYLSMDALARWLLFLVSEEQDESPRPESHTPTPLFNFVSRTSPLLPLSSPTRWLSGVWSPLNQTERLLPASLTGWVATNLKKKLMELVPGINKANPSPPSGLVEECLNSLSTAILRLEENAPSLQFTSEQVARGSELSDRLAALFCTFE